MNHRERQDFICALSFEDRCMAVLSRFADDGGDCGGVQAVHFGGDNLSLQQNIAAAAELGVNLVSECDRRDSKRIWRWVWESVEKSGPDVVVDVSCFPREVIGMILYALALQSTRFNRVRIAYTTPFRYSTQDLSLPEDSRKLSFGTRVIRTIIGYPGDFSSARKRHLFALAGHEIDRLLEVINYVEPTTISLSNEQYGSGTVEGANEFSLAVKAKLRESIGMPDFRDVVFFADSPLRTYEALVPQIMEVAEENITLVCMNTKLAFVGACLAGLHQRNVRIVYAVPDYYNDQYSSGVKESREVDISDSLLSAGNLIRQ